MHEHQDKITQELKDQINSAITDLREKMNGENVEAIEEGTKRVKDLSLEIGKQIYANQGQQQSEA